MRSRIYSAFLLLFLLSLFVAPAHAQGNKRLAGFSFNPADQLKKIAEKQLRDMITKAVGADVPLKLDQSTAFAEAPPPSNFTPHKLTSLSDLNRPLPPGDYAVDAQFYCTEYSIHRPPAGLPYKVGRTQGRLVKPLCALLNRGTLQGISPVTLESDAWRIQAGVSLDKWPTADQAIVHKLIPEYENKLQGDYIDQIQHTYDGTLKLVLRKSFDEELANLGDLGHQVMQLEKARQMLSDQSFSDDRLPDMLYQATGDGGNPVLASGNTSPSPWMQVRPGVVGRYTVIGGYLQKNLFEFRIGPDATAAGLVISPSHVGGQFRLADDTQQGTSKGPSLAQVMNIDESEWSDDEPDLISYSIAQAAQAAIIPPILSEPSPVNQAPNVASIVLTLDKPQVGVDDLITGTAVPEDSNGKPVPGASVTLTFAEKATEDAASTNTDNTRKLGSTTASGDKYPFSFSPNDTPGTVVVTASVQNNSHDDTSANADQANASAVIKATANEDVNTVKSLPKHEPPSLLTLANLCSNVYEGNAGYGDYKFIENNKTLVPNTSTHLDFVANTYATHDFSQVVIAIRGTVPSYLLNIAADKAFSGSIPTVAFAREVSDASAFVKKTQAKYPDANITITGHSLGGALAQVLGKASSLPAYAFNAPGARSLYDNLAPELGDFVANVNPSTINVNYRLYADQISLFGQPMGRVVILADPSYTDLALLKKLSDTYAAFKSFFPTFLQLHKMTTVIAQIADNAPQVSNIGEPNFTMVIQTGADVQK